MTALRRLAGLLRSPRAWTVLGMLAALGMLVVSGLMLLDLRRDAWEKAAQTSSNLLQVIERDVARNVEIIDLSLQSIVENLRAPGVAEASPALRQLILFDRVAFAKDVEVVLVLDEHGDSILDAASVTARRANGVDRDYFTAHKARSDLGLFISRPIASRLTGTPVVVFSRRIDKADGSFGGVAVASLSLSYFSHLFERIDLGHQGMINLYRRDGTSIVHYPNPDPLSVSPPNFAGTVNFKRFLRAPRGAFVGLTHSDGVRRHYAFVQFADLPLILNVAVATEVIDAAWRRKAHVLGGILFGLCGLTAGLSWLFGQELRRRTVIEAELARLSCTDVLTGLANRRRFDDALAAAFGRMQREGGGPLCLLIVDADHFKRYNDRYGHAVGDAVLKGLARSLRASVHRPDDLVARIGGEEFALLLPETDMAGAERVAGRIHREVAGLALEAVGIQAGTVTVSIGLACAEPGSAAHDLYRRADEALYTAKATGRARTCCAPRCEPVAHGRAARRRVRA